MRTSRSVHGIPGAVDRPDAAERRLKIVNVPNIISALRLPLAGAFFVVDGPVARGIILFLGGFSDVLDGWLARRLRMKSEAGAIIDPLADKLFVLVALAAFLPGPYLAWPGFLVLISRDLYVASGFLTGKALGVSVPAQSRPSGKLVTFLQVVTLFVLLLAPERLEVFLIVVAVASLIAILDYTVVGVTALRRRSRMA
ncbi:MAG: CDP-alcohol phosphatidyltransferase family protein [Gemmatimonadota bacterium]|nr:MAG: CDP-alcohol phosphatidyltransferase family protein [Gemmatimonadota bacterium]